MVLILVSAFIWKDHANCFGILLSLSCEETEYKNIFILIFDKFYNTLGVLYCHASNYKWLMNDKLKRICQAFILASI